MPAAQAQYILTLTCPDRPGIVRALADGIGQISGNILENTQFSDPATGTFCVRTQFETPNPNLAEVSQLITQMLNQFQAEIRIRNAATKRRVLLLVSKIDHCLVDLLYHWQAGELPIEIPLVISNHPDCKKLVAQYGIDYLELPVTPATKASAEAEILAKITELQIDFVVLARYMQILSDDFCAQLAGKIINIHHSFLPGFKGARPYLQAYERGVKLIGATAHFVTPILDEGPIIEQDVVRVNHAFTPELLTAIGKDVERRVLTRAVRWFSEDRVLLTGERTVVFS